MEETNDSREGTSTRENLKEKLKYRWQSLQRPTLDQIALARVLVALIALAEMLLPWAKLDGYAETMSGAELMAFAFTSPERGSIFAVSKLGALSVLLAPALVPVANLYGLCG